MHPESSDFQRLRELYQRLGFTPPDAPAQPPDRSADFAAEHQAELERLPSHLASCGVGETTVAAFGALRETVAIAEVAAFAASADLFALLIGAPGTGKTVAAASVLQHARWSWRDGEHVRWRLASHLGLFVRAKDLVRSMHADGELVHRAKRVGWLVLDELGSEYGDQGERWLAELDDLLVTRDEHMRRTVITSNLAAAQFRDRYGERVLSRIRGHGRVVVTGVTDLRARAPEGAR